jgi:hypothetical protein
MNRRQAVKMFGFILQRILNGIDVMIGRFANSEVEKMCNFPEI